MVQLDPHVAAAHVLVGSEVFGAHDRSAGHVERIEDRHQLALAVLLGKLVDQRPHELLVLAPLGDRGEARITGQVGNVHIGADAPGEVFPDRFLHHDVEPVVGAVRLAVDGVAELAAARVVAGARHLAHALVGRHGIFRHVAAHEALVVAEFHAAEVHHAVHHRYLDVLALPGLLGLAQRGEQADGEVQPGARVADLRAGDEGRAVGHAGGAHRAAHRLRHVLVGLEVGVGTARAEALDRSHHDLRVDVVDLLPAEAEAVEHAGAEILHDDVALLQQVDEHLLTLGALHVYRDRALVAVEHGEVQAVGVRHVAQLPARRVALRRLELDHVRAQPGEQLRAGRARLHVHALECLHGFISFLRSG